MCSGLYLYLQERVFFPSSEDGRISLKMMTGSVANQVPVTVLLSDFPRSPPRQMELEAPGFVKTQQSAVELLS